MCGIFGYVSNKDIDTDLFIKPIEKRGPDEKKIFSNKNFKMELQDYLSETLIMDHNRFLKI